MSWSSRLSRFSPFGRSTPTSTTVDDSDFSYITPSDLDTHLSRPSRDADVLVFRHKKISYPVHFPPRSIDDGKLSVGAARAAVAKKLADVSGGGTPLDPRRVRMFWKGRNLKDDAIMARDEGLSSDAQAEILCVIGEPISSASGFTKDVTPGAPAEDDEPDSDSDADGTSTPGGSSVPKRKRNRNRKKKKGGKASTGTSTPATPGALPGGGVPLPQVPTTPLSKLVAIEGHFHTTLLPLCEAYVASPPADKTKREYEYKKITETILQQVLLKLDGVDSEGLDEARLKRKEIIREAQSWLNRMDDMAKTSL